MNCARCHKTFTSRGHFEISRKDGSDKIVSAVQVCSLMCLAQWSYEECVRQGVRIVGGAQTAWQRLKEWVTGA